jgi:hypothetical protein
LRKFATNSRAANYAPKRYGTFLSLDKNQHQSSLWMSLYQYHKTTEKGYRAKANGEINVINEPQNTATKVSHSTPPPQTTKLTRLEKLREALDSAAAQTQHGYHHHNVDGHVHGGSERNRRRARCDHRAREHERGEEGQPAAGKQPKRSARKSVFVPQVVPEHVQAAFAKFAAAARAAVAPSKHFENEHERQEGNDESYVDGDGRETN